MAKDAFHSPRSTHAPTSGRVLLDPHPLAETIRHLGPGSELCPVSSALHPAPPAPLESTVKPSREEKYREAQMEVLHLWSHSPERAREASAVSTDPRGTIPRASALPSLRPAARARTRESSTNRGSDGAARLVNDHSFTLRADAGPGESTGSPHHLIGGALLQVSAPACHLCTTRRWLTESTGDAAPCGSLRHLRHRPVILRGWVIHGHRSGQSRPPLLRVKRASTRCLPPSPFGEPELPSRLLGLATPEGEHDDRLERRLFHLRPEDP